jgi:hypothetical protein
MHNYAGLFVACGEESCIVVHMLRIHRIMMLIDRLLALPLLFPQHLQHLERLINMFLWGKCRGEDVAHDALLIDDVGYASRQQSKCRGNAIKLPDLAPYIAQQDKGQAMLGCKTLVRLLGVRADTYDLCSGIFKDFVAVSKGACLGDTARSVIFGVKVEDDILLADKT